MRDSWDLRWIFGWKSEKGASEGFGSKFSGKGVMGSCGTMSFLKAVMAISFNEDLRSGF